MTGRASIVLCRAPRAPYWQLGPLPPAEGEMVLLGWRHDPAPTDAGVPSPVAHVLADALTTCARVTFLFPETEADAVQDDDLLYRTEEAAGLSRLGARLAGQPSRFTLLATRQTATAMRMFDVTGFDWSQQGQVVLLSDPAAPPIALDRGAIVELTSEAWLSRGAKFVGGPVHGVLRPGVDGDVAGLFTADADFLDRFSKALEAACTAAGVGWAVTADDQAFADRLSAD